jgi:hypothetical protein
MNTGNDMLDYPQLITRDLILQLPFVQISEFAKKRRAPNWKEIEKEIKLIVERNNVELIDLLANSMLKAITEEVTLGNVTEDTLEELKDKMGYLNSKFRRLDAYFDTLTTYEQRDLLLPFIEKEINTLVRNKDSFKTILISKEQWNQNDASIYTYYLLYLDCINVWTNALKNASKYTITGRLNIIKGLLFAYKPLLIAYMLNKPIPNQVLLRKLAELRASVNPLGIYTIEPKVYNMFKTISEISPI